MLPITNTLKVMEDIEKTFADAADLFKGGSFSLLSIGKILTVLHDIQTIVRDAPAALPELKDLDSNEVGQLGKKSYELVQTVITNLAAK